MTNNKPELPKYRGRVSLDEITSAFPYLVKELDFGNLLYSNVERTLNVVYNPAKELVMCQPYVPKSLGTFDFTTPIENSGNCISTPARQQYTGKGNGRRRQSPRRKAE